MDPKDLRSEFSRIGARWLRLAVGYGVMRVVACVAAGAVVAYALDRALALPPMVRIALALVEVALVVHLVRRWIVYPIGRAPSERDVACAIERRFPQFDGRLLSVLELEGEAIDKSRNVSTELVSELRRETAALRGQIPIESIFEFRALKRVAALAALGSMLIVGFAATRPELASIFARRWFGSDARWPQRTTLRVAFPDSGTHFMVEQDDDPESGAPVRVRIARGASLPVAVTVIGEDPEAIDLVAEDESGSETTVALSSTGAGEWAGRFRSVRESFTFRPVGGDDDGTGREVEVLVFAPPAVGEVVTELVFPSYTGLEPRREPRGDVEAPVFTAVKVEISTPELVTSGQLVFDSELGPIDLVRSGDPEARRWEAKFEVRQSCAYSIHLVAESGFKNLEPPTYSVLAIKDRAPTVRVLEPTRGDIDVTPDGIVALRVAADDDYGITELFCEIKPFGSEKAEVITFPTPLDGDVRRRLEYEHFDLRGRAFERGEAEARTMQTGESLVYRAIARDNFVDPTAAPDVVSRNETALLERRVDIVSASEKLRLLTERQIRTKEEVRSLRALQVEKIERLDAIIKEFEHSEGDRTAGADDIAALEVGQNQVTTRSLKLCREFSDIFEEYLLNRLDPSAGADGLLVIVLDRKRSSTVIDGFDVRVWRPLVESNANGSFGRLDVLGRIFEMLGCLIAIADEHSTAAARSLSEARTAIDEAARPAALRNALDAERRVLEQLDLLITKLDEWENFQEVLGLFRALIDDQRELNERTRRALK